MQLRLSAYQIGASDVGEAFTWGGKEYIITEAFTEINADTKEPTGYYILEVRERTAPGPVGPTDD